MRSWDAVERGIRALRVSLLTEHTGLAPRAAMRVLVKTEGLVDRLGQLARAEVPRIVPYAFPRAGEQGPLDELVVSVGDPERAPVAEDLYEEILERPRGLVARAVTALHELRGTRS